jgi:hypothetical protein
MRESSSKNWDSWNVEQTDRRHTSTSDYDPGLEDFKRHERLKARIKRERAKLRRIALEKAAQEASAQ